MTEHCEHSWEPWHHAITGPFWIRLCSVCRHMEDTDEPPTEVYGLRVTTSTGARDYFLLPPDHPAYKRHKQ